LANYDDFRAADLAELLSTEILDASDAAAFLGIARNSIEYAAYRHRIAFVQYGAKKLFTRKDLMDYAANRGRGRDSHLQEAPHFLAKAEASQGD
jgi:hypothetical protein